MTAVHQPLLVTIIANSHLFLETSLSIALTQSQYLSPSLLLTLSANNKSDMMIVRVLVTDSALSSLKIPHSEAGKFQLLQLGSQRKLFIWAKDNAILDSGAA